MPATSSTRLRDSDLAKLVLDDGESEALDFKARPPWIGRDGCFYDDKDKVAQDFVTLVLSMAAAQRQHLDRPSRIVYGVNQGGSKGQRECWSVDRLYYKDSDVKEVAGRALTQARLINDPREDKAIRAAAVSAELKKLAQIADVWGNEQVAQIALEKLSKEWMKPPVTLAYHVYPAPEDLVTVYRPDGPAGRQIGVLTIDASSHGGVGEVSFVAKECGLLREGDYCLRSGQHNDHLAGARLRVFIEEDFTRRVFRSLAGASIVLACGGVIVLYMTMQAILTATMHIFRESASTQAGQIRLVGLYLLALIGNIAVFFTTCLWVKKLPRDPALHGAALIVPCGVAVAIICWVVSAWMDLDKGWLRCALVPSGVFFLGCIYVVLVRGRGARIK